jgi:response regulator RpfG family c-di-GMP phosphodiesterase
LGSDQPNSSPYIGPEGRSSVLIVDDEEVITILLQEALSEHFKITFCSSGEDAVPILVNHPPDVLVADKNLPGMSGIDLLRQAKQLKPETEVILITGYASLESAIEALRFGAYDYLIKPFDDLNIVVEKIRLATEKRALGRERQMLMEQVMTTNEELRRAQERLKLGYLQTLSSMVTALETRDSYTRGHSDRVAELSGMIGKQLGLSGHQLFHLVDGARLHDIGKIGIREEVLNKATQLSNEEFDHIKTHPLMGAEIIGKIEIYAHLIPMIRHHHERYDGKGYPNGLVGQSIPLEARIISVADTFDAMTSSRPYRRTRSPGEALRIIREVAGSQLDPQAVKAFLAIQAKVIPDQMTAN